MKTSLIVIAIMLVVGLVVTRQESATVACAP